MSAGAEARWINGFSVAATFEGDFSNVTESYAGKGTIRYQCRPVCSTGRYSGWMPARSTISFILIRSAVRKSASFSFVYGISVAP